MPIPEFIVEMRELIGSREMWMPAVTAVVRHGAGADEEILLVRRVDNGAWTPVTGIPDPREEPAVACVREAMEEAGVAIRVDRLASTSVVGPMTYPNGDQASYLDLTFACTWLDGEAHVADDESVDVGWFRRADVPEMSERMLQRVDAALADESAARFVNNS